MATNYTKQIVKDYCVLDTETTGLSAYYDEIIEIGLIRVRDDVIVERFSQLLHPRDEVSDFITELTGITNEMLEGMPSIIDVKEKVLAFIGDDIVLGHNTSFDIRFLNEGFKTKIDNLYMDTMQFSRKVYPELKHHRLSDMTKYLGLSNNEHRALADCISTKELYDAVKKTMAEKNLEIHDLWRNCKGRTVKGIDIKTIMADSCEIDTDGFFYNKHVVFTGKLEKMVRQEAMQIVVNMGAVLDNSVTKKTNLLILGDNDYNSILLGEKSNKHKKAEQLILDGNDLEIIDERTFYDILAAELEKGEADCSENENEYDLFSGKTMKWKNTVRNMLGTLEEMYELPKNSLWLSDNYSIKNPDNIISHSVCIWEPDYPNQGGGHQEVNKTVMTIYLSNVQSRPNDIDLYIRDFQYKELEDKCPQDAVVLTQTKSDLDTGTIRVRFNNSSETLKEFIKEHTIYCIKNYESKAGGFGCCSKYEQCSNAKRCLHENKLYSKACAYRKNLEMGRIFYGKNRNIDD
ncbi:MAG: 3'-5' exoribonuclease [Lachnospiraceae bacterium]|nr:3'-5' exoribonuclease [Lachnospiraceae bacterium]